MKGATGGVKNTLYDGYRGPRMSREMLMARVRNVIDNELTDKQRRALEDYYLARKTIPALAAEYGVNKSTVSRTLKRAEARLRRFLKY